MSFKSEDLISKIKQARQDNGLTQRDLSARSGLTQSHISQIERGTLEPGLAALITLARALDLEIAVVPRKFLPAVKGILQDTTSRRPTSIAHAQTRDVAKFERLLRKQRQTNGSFADLDQLADSLRLLRFAPMTAADLATLRNAYDLLEGQDDPTPPLLVKAVANEIRSIRNRLAQVRNEGEPKAAYAFDDEDGDA